jgi:hypothetical protein
MYEGKKGIGDIISTITVTVLFMVILSLVVFAARGYQHASEVQNMNSNTRAVGSYVVNCVKDSNTSEVAVENISGTDCLVIRSSDGYEHRIFMIDGRLMEEYVEAGVPLDPETALENVPTEATLDINAPMFDVLGRQVDKTYRGIVIQNGQAFLLK